MTIDGSTTTTDELTATAMKIIVRAGDARTAVSIAYRALASGDRKGAADGLDKAREAVTEAHQAQTDVVQAEAAGTQHRVTLLFSHAQDSLMTVKSEVVTAANVMTLFDSIDQRLVSLEEKFSALTEAPQL